MSHVRACARRAHAGAPETRSKPYASSNVQGSVVVRGPRSIIVDLRSPNVEPLTPPRIAELADAGLRDLGAVAHAELRHDAVTVSEQQIVPELMRDGVPEAVAG